MKKVVFILALIIGFTNITFAVENIISEVVDIKFAKEIKNREPIYVSNIFPNDIKKIYCWTKTKAFKVPTYVIHEWYTKVEKWLLLN